MKLVYLMRFWPVYGGGRNGNKNISKRNGEKRT